MNFRITFTADKTSLQTALADAERFYAKPFPAPVGDLIGLALGVLPAGWQAEVECSASLSLDGGAVPGPSTVMLRVTPKKK